MRIRKRLLLPVLAGLGLAAYFVVQRGAESSNELLASGTVEATEARLGFQAAGRIEWIGAREGDAVQEGAELARLDRTELQARRQQAEAQITAARAALLELERGFPSEEVAQARAASEAARQRRVDAERDLERSRRLHSGGAVSQESLDKAALALDMARSQESQAEQQLQLLARGPRRERVEAQSAQVEHAQASLRVIDAQLDNMVVRAPFAGVVTVRHHEPGETVAAGTAILTLMNRADRWVRIYVPEHRIAAVHFGQPATIHNDTYPDKAYRGEVSFIASEAEFTPKSVQTAEERVKLVYAAKVRVLEDSNHELKPGMPVDVQLEISP